MLNKPTIIPTAYLAPIEYYAYLIQKKNCLIEYNEYFIKQSIRNRCNIYGANGKLRLTIPKKRSNNPKNIISKTKICYKENWQKKHCTSIESAYNSSPFFQYYKHELHELFFKKEEYLLVFNNKLQELILKLINSERNLKKTSKYELSVESDDKRNYNWNNPIQKKYNQVFMEKHGFIKDLSIIDLLFNLGPQSIDYLKNVTI